MTKKKKSYVPIAKIKNALRRIHLHDKQRRIAKDRAKIDAALFKCQAEDCNRAAYEGQSDKNFEKLVEKWTELELVREKIELNHTVPVAPTERYDSIIEELQKNESLVKILNVDKKYIKGLLELMIYISRLWVSEEGYDCLCSQCHAKITEGQVKDRVESGSLKRK